MRKPNNRGEHASREEQERPPGRRMRRAGLLGSAVVAGSAVGVGAAGLITERPAEGHHPPPTEVDFGDSGSYSYDYHDGNTLSHGDVDWPITILFYDNASINRIGSIVDPVFPKISGERQHAFLRSDNILGFPHWKWDRDGGRTQFACDAPHLRVYAHDPPDYLGYSWQKFGHHVIGTTHWDLNHGCSGEDLFGWSRLAGDQFTGYFKSRGYTVEYDAIQVPTKSKKGDHWHESETRWYQSDGFMNTVKIP